MTSDCYIPDNQMLRAADAVAALQPRPFAGRFTRDQVLLALGEFGAIWPASSSPTAKLNEGAAAIARA